MRSRSVGKYDTAARPKCVTYSITLKFPDVIKCEPWKKIGPRVSKTLKHWTFNLFPEISLHSFPSSSSLNCCCSGISLNSLTGYNFLDQIFSIGICFLWLTTLWHRCEPRLSPRRPSNRLAKWTLDFYRWQCAYMCVVFLPTWFSLHRKRDCAFM